MSDVSFQQPAEPEMAEDDTIDAPERLELNAARPEPYGLDDLIRIMAILRTPVIGCPWDLEQDFGSIAPYTIEEAYEVAEAIERGDLADLRDELGDLLLQVVFHARMAEEQATRSPSPMWWMRFAANWCAAIPTSLGMMRPEMRLKSKAYGIA